MEKTLTLTLLLALGCGSSNSGPSPRKVTLTSPSPGMRSEVLRLADGRLGASGDLTHMFAVQNSLMPGEPVQDETFSCPKGTFPALSDVPKDELPCMIGGGQIEDHWQDRFFYGGPGDSALVRDLTLTATYRLRILAATVTKDAEGALSSASVTFEYEPVPAP